MTTEAQQDVQQDEVEYAPAWKPTAGDRIKGTLKNVELIDPQDRGRPYPVLLLETVDGDCSVHAFHTVLRNELARRAPKLGDEVDITYVGKRPGGRGDGYHAYRVGGPRGGKEFDWSQVLPEDERPVQDIPIAPAPLPVQPAPKSVVDTSDDLPF